LYFVTFFALACQGRFIALFLGGFGISSQHVGLILAAGTAVSLFATPFCAAVCDFLQEKRTVLISCVCGAMLSVTLYAFPWMFSEWFTDPTGLMAWLLFVRMVYCFCFTPVNTLLDTLAVISLQGQCLVFRVLP
jgi:hypothetical protein